MSEDIIRHFFRVVDRFDPCAFVEMLAPDVNWWFGNNDPVIGSLAVSQIYTGLCGVLRSMRHTVSGIWSDGPCFTVENRITYDHISGQIFDYPAYDIIFIQSGKIQDIRIFIDCHEMTAVSAGLSAAQYFKRMI